jgi:hypothetical protein
MIVSPSPSRLALSLDVRGRLLFAVDEKEEVDGGDGNGDDVVMMGMGPAKYGRGTRPGATDDCCCCCCWSIARNCTYCWICVC